MRIRLLSGSSLVGSSNRFGHNVIAYRIFDIFSLCYKVIEMGFSTVAWLFQYSFAPASHYPLRCYSSAGFLLARWPTFS